MLCERQLWLKNKPRMQCEGSGSRSYAVHSAQNSDTHKIASSQLGNVHSCATHSLAMCIVRNCIAYSPSDGTATHCLSCRTIACCMHAAYLEPTAMLQQAAHHFWWQRAIGHVQAGQQRQRTALLSSYQPNFLQHDCFLTVRCQQSW